MSPVDITPPPTLSRQYPHVDDVTDWRAKQSLRLLWDRIFSLEERLQAVSATQGDLVSTVNTQEDQLDDVRVAAGEALAIAQGAGGSLPSDPGGGAGGGGGEPGGGGGGGGEPGGGGLGGDHGYGESTMPNYKSIVESVLLTQFVQPPTIPLAQGDNGKAQLTRAAAWAIYATNPDVRLLKKTGGAQAYNMSTDVILLATDGSFADVCTYKTSKNGKTCTVTATWGDHDPDDNTNPANADNYIVPTLEIAMLPGPMQRV